MKSFVPVTACLIHNNYQSKSMVGECCRHLPYIEPAAKFTANPIQGLWWKDLLKWLKIIMSSRRTTASTRHCWADVGPASQTLGQHQPSIGSMSRVCRYGAVSSGHSFGGGPPAKTGYWPCVGSMLAHRQRRWSNIETTRGQCHVFAGEVGGVHGTNRSVTIQLDEGWQTSLCVYTYA